MAQAQLEANALRFQMGLGPRVQGIAPPPVLPAPPAGWNVKGCCTSSTSGSCRPSPSSWRRRCANLCLGCCRKRWCLGEKALIPDVHGGAEVCFVKRAPQSEAETFKLEDLRVLPVFFDLQGIRRRELASEGGGLQLEGPASAMNDIIPWILGENFRDTSWRLRTWMLVQDLRGNGACRSTQSQWIAVGWILVRRRMQVIREAHRISLGAPDWPRWLLHGLAIQAPIERHWRVLWRPMSLQSCCDPKRGQESGRGTSCAPP